jgi:hypothetical protein
MGWDVTVVRLGREVRLGDKQVFKLQSSSTDCWGIDMYRCSATGASPRKPAANTRGPSFWCAAWLLYLQGKRAFYSQTSKSPEGRQWAQILCAFNVMQNCPGLPHVSEWSGSIARCGAEGFPKNKNFNLWSVWNQ